MYYVKIDLVFTDQVRRNTVDGSYQGKSIPVISQQMFNYLELLLKSDLALVCRWEVLTVTSFSNLLLKKKKRNVKSKVTKNNYYSKKEYVS